MMHTVPQKTLTFPVTLQRNSFGPRLVARAGDVWRCMQDVVSDESSSVGWTPERYVEENTMFVVRSMTVKHEREVGIGETLQGRTWASRDRRSMLFTRQVRMFSGDEFVAGATQEWAYLTRDLQATKASKGIYDAFSVTPGFPDVELPAYAAVEGKPLQRFEFTVWHGWMDPHGHVNHAAYVDYCDEGVARVVAGEGGDPQALRPLFETVHFRAAIGAGEAIAVETVECGAVDGARVFKHRILSGQKVCATATLIRRAVT